MIYAAHMERLTLEERGKDMTDEEVLAASVGQPSLFALIVRKYEAPFLRKARSIIGDETEAEDIVQEAFTKIYFNANKFKKQEGAQFSSWGYRILINTALTHYQKRKRRGAVTAELDEEIWQLIPDKDLRQFEKLTLSDEVASVLARMPAPLSRALSSFFLEGKSQEEIAEAEGLSVGAIKTRVHRAKAQFKKIRETLEANSELQ